MKLPQIKKFKWNYLALSFLVPFGALLILMVFAKLAPFGTNSFMSSDAWHQYFPFFKAYRRALLSGESLLYNWTGMGVDYLGLLAYYLGSPLNLLCVLVPESWLLGLFEFLFPLKLSLAGLFFAVFLKKVFGKDDLSLPLFSGFYATCAWSIGYMWNIMWLDGFYLLPLVALGTLQLLKDRKFILYTVSLFLSIAINYYVGFFICIFVLLVFICYQICRFTTFRRFFEDLCRIALFSALAIGMTAVISLPTLAALQNTYSSVNKFPQDFNLNMIDGDSENLARNTWNAFKTAKENGSGNAFILWLKALFTSFPPIMEGMKKVAGNMAGGLTPTFKNSTELPNIFCGLGSSLFAFLFLTSREVKPRDKICSVFLLVFFILSFLIRQLDYIWHGFHFPNEIPYRFSFLYSFVVLYMAYRAFLLRDTFKLRQLLTAGLLYVGIVLCREDFSDPVFWVYNGIFLVLYLGVLVYYWLQHRPVKVPKKERAKFQKNRADHKCIATFALAGVLFMELIVSTVNATVQFPFAYVGAYPRGGESVQTVVDYMQEMDDSPFYRAEVTHLQTLNDGPLIGYNGITAFTSSANVKVTEFMQALGYAAKNNWNRYAFEESSPLANLFLNLKYMVEREGSVEPNPYFDEIYRSGNVALLKNNAYLPLGFLADSALGDLKFQSIGNAFTFQNQLFTAATGLTEEVWTHVAQNDLTITPNGTGLTSQSPNGYCSYKNGGSETMLHYTYTIREAGFLCLDLTMSARNKYYVFRNGSQLFTEEMTGLPQTLAVCDVEPGDTIQLQIRCKANESGNITIHAATLHEEYFRLGYDILNSSTLELTEFSTTKVSGIIDCDREGLLYTSIPQNGENWRVSVDGQPAEVTLIGDVMLGVKLTEGVHEISFAYHNTAFNLGLGISLGCAVIFGGIIFMIYFYPQLKKKGKFQKEN